MFVRKKKKNMSSNLLSILHSLFRSIPGEER